MSAKRFRKLWINEDGDIAITDDGVDLIFTEDAFLIFLNELAEKEATINKLEEKNMRLKNRIKQFKSKSDDLSRQLWSSRQEEKKTRKALTEITLILKRLGYVEKEE